MVFLRLKEKPPDFFSEGYFISGIGGAEGRIRTDTGLPPPVFEFDAMLSHKFVYKIGAEFLRLSL